MNKKPFKIGLVLSGGATAGAYTAGVMDFLLEALSEWEKAAKSGNEPVPLWSVQIDNMTASSAGALVTMLTAVSLGTHYNPMTKRSQSGELAPQSNLLYRSWVSEFGNKMFSLSDLPPLDAKSDQVVPVRSLVNSTFLRSMADDICLDVVSERPIPRWAYGLRLFITITNTRGIPYAADMCVTLNEEDRKYRMLRHSDCVGFETNVNSTDQTTFKLNVDHPRRCADWQRLYDVAASSASVPILFPSMVISRPFCHYNKEATTTPKMSPDWPSSRQGKYLYEFNANDGGFFNNEPIGLSRNAMEKLSNKKMGKSAGNVWGACILIDCNSNASVTVDLSKKTAPNSLLESLTHSLSAVINEAAFKDTDFFEAMDSENFSQYLISPIREGRRKAEPILATSTLNLFGGLLHKQILHHDFMLGRRNCQQFLRQHFSVDVEKGSSNDVFAGIKEWCGENEERIPIIPLLGTARNECPLPEWPRFSKQVQLEISQQFRAKVFNRLIAIITTYAKNMGLLKPRKPWNILRKVQDLLIRMVIRTIAIFAYKTVDKKVQESLAHFD